MKLVFCHFSSDFSSLTDPRGSQWHPQALTTMFLYFLRMTLELSSKYSTEMPWSCVGAQQGLGTVSGLMKCTWKHRGSFKDCGGCSESAFDQGLFGAYQSLHYSVIGGVHVRVEREGAFSLAVVRCVALWCNDPVLLRGMSQSVIKMCLNTERFQSRTCHPRSLKLT